MRLLHTYQTEGFSQATLPRMRFFTIAGTPAVRHGIPKPQGGQDLLRRCSSNGTSGLRLRSVPTTQMAMPWTEHPKKRPSFCVSHVSCTSWKLLDAARPSTLLPP